MGSAVSQIGAAISNPIRQIGSIGGAVTGAALGGPAGALLGRGAGEEVSRFATNLGKSPGALTGLAVGGPAGALIGNELLRPGDAPEAPGIDPSLSEQQKKQLEYAKQFRGNLGAMKAEMGDRYRGQVNRQTEAGVRGQEKMANKRGLLYSGINEGNKAAERSSGAAKTASGIAGINQSLEGAANTLDQQAIQTGLGIQQAQQDIQNSIYSQAMAQLASQNQMTGAALGMGAGLLLTGAMRGG